MPLICLRTALLPMLGAPLHALAASLPSIEHVDSGLAPATVHLNRHVSDELDAARGPTTGLETRQFDHFDWVDWMNSNRPGVIAVAGTFVTSKIILLGWAGLIDGCREAAVAEVTKDKVLKGLKCAADALAMFFSVFFLAATSATTISTVKAFLWDARNRLPFKRDDVAGFPDELLADAFGGLDGLDVRHVGFWNDTVTPGAVHHSKRGDVDSGGVGGVMRSVFSVRSSSSSSSSVDDDDAGHQGFHFSYTDINDTDGTFAIRAAFGGGVSSLSPERRAEDDIFSDGNGIDVRAKMLVDRDPDRLVEHKKTRESLSDQLQCLLSSDGMESEKMHSNTMYLKFYDAHLKQTSAVANVAIYTTNNHGAVEQMGGFKPELDIDENVCNMHDEI
ncbi:hypothetical protein B0H66DRAFT_600732 [Apodospora peruviana]|uniref:Uncharacterized protein n=1 Tax=Apodospora peruviana TaxID=516989 RepID=A0AAE0MBS0_9PEZI|nr:hypothetical protein B0H66DRAFT_600732 [Apodospora peruviana]